MAAVGWLQRRASISPAPGRRIGVAGYAEGGLIAFYSAALDPRIDAALVSGYFDSRQRLAEEPAYRNLFGLLEEFGDAEIACLIAPRSLIVEHSPAPRTGSPVESREARTGAAAGELATPDYESVEREVERAVGLLQGGESNGMVHLKLICGNEGMATGPGSDRALVALLNGLGVPIERVRQPGANPSVVRTAEDASARQQRQFKEMGDYFCQRLIESARTRAAFLREQAKTASLEEWARAGAVLRSNFWEEVVGRLPLAASELKPCARKVELAARGEATAHQTEAGYEIRLDMAPGLFAWGYLLAPRDLAAGERRPVVVCCQEESSAPGDGARKTLQPRASAACLSLAARLREEGFVVFLPQRPDYGAQFSRRERQANSLGLSLASFTVARHSRILEWLTTLPFVDTHRVAFMGLGCGSFTELCVPAVLEGYSACLWYGSHSDLVRADHLPGSMTGEASGGQPSWPGFTLAGGFGFDDVGAMIAPRPFMLGLVQATQPGMAERGIGEWATLQGIYEGLGVGDRFVHEEVGAGRPLNESDVQTFLHRRLRWLGPEPENHSLGSPPSGQTTK
jgi:dienelactone hydrolase